MTQTDILQKFLNKTAKRFTLIFCSNERILRKQGVIVGQRSDIQSIEFGSEPYLVSIGDNVQITLGVKLFTHSAGCLLRQEISNFDSF